MSREKFLKTLQYFDENFNGIVNNDKELDEFYKTNKKFNDKEKSSKYSQSHNRIDIKKVKQITQKNDNCFVPFYNLSDDSLYWFFEELSKIELGLIYFDDFSEKYRDIKTRNKNKTKQKKIDEVMEMLVSDARHYENTIKDLKSLRAALDNNHFTKRQLFQDLLTWVAAILNDGKQSRKVTNSTNDLIKYYFDQDITFSREENIDKYQYNSVTYYYTDAKGISIYHS